MNREIKFRGRRVDKNEWVIGLPRHGSSGDIIYICGWFGEEGFETYQEVEVDPKTIGQYSGLRDQKGNDLYEGDIVRAWIAGTVDERPHIEQLTIVFKQGSFCSENNRRSKLLSSICKQHPLNKYYECFLEGNIHETPELLKQ